MRKNIRDVALDRGCVINRYKVIRPIASGGFGVVYSAISGTGKVVAIKEFLPSFVKRRAANQGLVITNKSHQKRFASGMAVFFDEAETLSKITSDRVVSILDIFKANGTAYFVMPMERGHTLDMFRRRNVSTPGLSAKRVKFVFTEAAKSIEVLHRCGVLHLDIKPGNLWLRPNGGVVAMDLGASKWLDDNEQSRHRARTPGFAAPEQYCGPKHHGKLTQKTDVYGLCASLVAVLTRASPSPADKRTQEREPLFLPSYCLSSRLLRLARIGTTLTPAGRFSSIYEFRMALESVVMPNSDRDWAQSGRFDTGCLLDTPIS